MRNFCLFTIISAVALPLCAQSDPLSAGEKGFYAVVKNNVIKAAEKMPESNYGFRPSDDVRTFGQLVGHVADAQYLFCSSVVGKDNPKLNIEKTKTSKADLIKALNDAVA